MKKRKESEQREKDNKKNSISPNKQQKSTRYPFIYKLQGENGGVFHSLVELNIRSSRVARSQTSSPLRRK